jgi:hypothetical protein
VTEQQARDETRPRAGVPARHAIPFHGTGRGELPISSGSERVRSQIEPEGFRVPSDLGATEGGTPLQLVDSTTIARKTR